jgi:hypothetical protein
LGRLDASKAMESELLGEKQPVADGPVTGVVADCLGVLLGGCRPRAVAPTNHQSGKITDRTSLLSLEERKR